MYVQNPSPLLLVCRIFVKVIAFIFYSEKYGGGIQNDNSFQAVYLGCKIKEFTVYPFTMS